MLPLSGFPHTLLVNEKRRAWDWYQACLWIMDTCEEVVETGMYGGRKENNRSFTDLAEVKDNFIPQTAGNPWSGNDWVRYSVIF